MLRRTSDRTILKSGFWTCSSIVSRAATMGIPAASMAPIWREKAGKSFCTIFFAPRTPEVFTAPRDPVAFLADTGEGFGLAAAAARTMGLIAVPPCDPSLP
jgi:hypothetical protein